MGNPETAALVKSGERMGIQTIGIGIGLDVKSVYPKSIRVNDVAELGKASFRQIKLAA
jgi:cobalamin biosynthesis protein CobT